MKLEILLIIYRLKDYTGEVLSVACRQSKWPRSNGQTDGYTQNQNWLKNK